MLREPGDAVEVVMGCPMQRGDERGPQGVIRQAMRDLLSAAAIRLGIQIEALSPLVLLHLSHSAATRTNRQTLIERSIAQREAFVQCKTDVIELLSRRRAPQLDEGRLQPT